MFKFILWAALLLCGTSSLAQPVKLIIPFPPGGGSDHVARIIQSYLDTKNTNLFFDHRPGAHGLIGKRELFSTPGNSNALLLLSGSNLAILDHLHNEKPSYSFVSELVYTPMVIISNDFKIDFKSFVNNVKSEKVSFGHGSAATMVATYELIELIGGKDIVHVNFKGAAPNIANVIGGHVKYAIVPLNTVASLIKSNKVNPIAITCHKRLDQLSNIPCVNEFYTGFVASQYWGVVMSNVDQQVVLKYNNLFADMAVNRQFNDKLRESFLFPALELGPVHMAKKYERTSNLLRKNKLNLE